jgi:hypothetical protein
VYNVCIANIVKGLPVNRILLGLAALLLSGSVAGAGCPPWGTPISYYPSFYSPVPTFTYVPTVYYVVPVYYYVNPIEASVPAAIAPVPIQAPPTVPQREVPPPRDRTTPKPKSAVSAPAKKDIQELPQPKKVKTPTKAKEPMEAETSQEPLARLQIEHFWIDRTSKTEEGVVEAKVGFFNHTDRDLTLLIQGEEVPLPKDEYVTLRLPREFKWAEKGETAREVKIPADAEGLEIVFRK